MQYLNCDSNRQVNNLSPLRELKNLQFLNCSNSQVNNLDPLRELKNLRDLRLSCIQVKGFTSFANALKDLQNLQELDCRGNQALDGDNASIRVSHLTSMNNFEEKHPNCKITWRDNW